MGIGFSLFLMALGAILAFAVNVSANEFDINTIGYILLGVGLFGALLSVIFWSSWGGFGGGTDRATAPSFDSLVGRHESAQARRVEELDI